MSAPSRRHVLGLTPLVFAGALTACSTSGSGGSGTASGRADSGSDTAGSGASDSSSSASAGADSSATGTWPRTVSVGGKDVTIDAAPTRIVALSTETGDLVLELVGADRVVGIAEGSTSATSGNQVELASEVATVVKGAPSPDPEQVLALDPHLVVMTARHDGEQSVGTALESSGVPSAEFGPVDFSSPDAVIESTTTLGVLLGAEDAAKEITDRIAGEVTAVEEAIGGASEKPRTLGLMARGGQLMIMGTGTPVSDLIELAGGTSIAKEQGWNATPSADPEVILQATPDVILVQDFHGAGLGPFEGLLRNQALTQVPAVANDRIELVDARTTSGTAGSRIGEGLAQIARILHPDAF